MEIAKNEKNHQKLIVQTFVRPFHVKNSRNFACQTAKNCAETLVAEIIRAELTKPWFNIDCQLSLLFVRNVGQKLSLASSSRCGKPSFSLRMAGVRSSVGAYIFLCKENVCVSKIRV